MTDTHHGGLERVLEHVGHLLPEQAPLHAFVHHNTLHAFEHLPFEEGLEAAAAVFDAEPYPKEEMLASYVKDGLIQPWAILAEIEADRVSLADLGEVGGLSWAQFALSRLQTCFEVPQGSMLEWLVRETPLLADWASGVAPERRMQLDLAARACGGDKFALLGRLWENLASAPSMVSPGRAVRPRDGILQATGADPDVLVHGQLIRLVAAFLDQGVAYWTMPDRSFGFYRAFRSLYAQPLGSPALWLRGLQSELARQESMGWSAEDAVHWALTELGTNEAACEPLVRETLLSLRGFAGMIRQMELRPDKAVGEAVPARLLDYLAVQLTLDVFAARWILESHGRKGSNLGAFCGAGKKPGGAAPGSLQYEAFVMAQVAVVDVACLLEPKGARRWIEFCESLPNLKRRQLLLRAFERTQTEQLAQGLLAHAEYVKAHPAPPPQFQAVFCIDDREESYRRHLEEVEPAVQTYSYPGFFGVAMRFHGAEEPRHRDLCPAVMKPTHVVRERLGGQTLVPRASAYRIQVGSKTLLRGFLVSALGLVALVPLVLGVLFPRWFHLKRSPKVVRPTRLDFFAGASQERDPETGLRFGYSLEEMTKIVSKLLHETGLVRDFCPLVLVVGHGSSSINNPHVAAYGCGATAGGCGGPNARVWAAMANRSDVRQALALAGILIPDSTVFVGGMHDTCTDDVILEPGDPLSVENQKLLASAQAALARASARNAHERCRLFRTLPLSLSPDQAKAAVEARSVDLSEARPEYNHAKNSIAFVGRRQWTRGLFLDQRSFLVSYDPTMDPDGSHLLNALLGSVPVGMGINLEYFFGTLDQRNYGAGSKLPHNVTGLVGVMDGHGSDLRTGLYAQMVELHEPLRLMAVIDAEPAVLQKLVESHARLGELVRNGWVRVFAFVPERQELSLFTGEGFQRLTPEPAVLPVCRTSLDYYQGRRESLPCAHIEASFGRTAA